MSEPFAFGLDESAALAEKIYQFVGADTSGWSSVDQVWRKRKAKLLDAIGPSGRIVKKIEYVVTPAERWQKATENLSPYVPAVAIDIRDMEAGAIQPNSTLFLWLQRHGIKSRVRKGLKFSRAMAAIVQEHWQHWAERTAGIVETERPGWIAQPMTADRASSIVSNAMQASAGTGSINMVLSANIFDILASSELASWKSCHRLNGEYRVGPLQYLMDHHTMVAYTYTEQRDQFRIEGSGTWRPGVKLPFKLWRQLVHVDLDNRAAAFMRHYPQEGLFRDDVHKSLRDMVEELIRKACGLPEMSSRTIKRHDEDGESPFGRTGANFMAYVDRCTSTIRLGEGKLRLELANSIVCPVCGTDTDDWDFDRDDPEFACRDCGGTECHGCGCRIQSGNECCGDDESWCQDCFNERFTYCECCDEYTSGSIQDVHYLSQATGRTREETWCAHCYRDGATCCDDCGEWWRDEHLTQVSGGNSVCPACLEDDYCYCDQCDTHVPCTEMGENNCCEGCQPEENDDGQAAEDVSTDGNAEDVPVSDPANHG